MKKSLPLLSILLFLMFYSASAQWDGNPATADNPVAVGTPDNYALYSVSDGLGGMIVAWTANDNSGNTLIYVQRKSNIGQVVWGDSTTPVQIATSPDYKYIDDVTADGAGGAYISWEDQPNDTGIISDVYVQHVNAEGATLLTTNGYKVNPTNQDYSWFIKLAVDTSGFIATWTDEHDNPANDSFVSAQVFAQRYNNSGTPQWITGGIQVCTATGYRADPAILNDGNSGAFIAFADSRNSIETSDGNFSNIDIYAQHISSSGTRLWTNNGAVICNLPTDQDMADYNGNIPSILSDGAGGLILTFETYIDDTDNDTGNYYAQRLNANGTMLWTAAGVPLATPDATSKNFTGMVSNTAGGSIMLWEENSTTGDDSALIAQDVTSTGAVSWGTNGKTITSLADGLEYFDGSAMAGDGAGNYVINWSATDSNDSTKLLGQKLSSTGIAQWAVGGANICTNPNADPYGPCMVKSDSANVIVAWNDYRNENSGGADIYAAKITTAGTLVSSYAYITTADGNWNTPATWLGGVVPPPGVDVIVKNKVTGNLTTTCNSLTVETPGSLNINKGINITILH